jgi:hypothetical protein
MLHSLGRLGLKPDEEKNGEQAAPIAAPQSAKAEPAHTGYSKRETDYMRSQGHHSIADEIDAQREPLPPYVDPAEPILRAHGIDAETAANLWDIFHSVRSSRELIEKLQPLDIPNGTKDALVRAKSVNDPAPNSLDRVERVVGAIKSMTKLDAPHARGGDSALRTAEKHPNILRVVTDAVKGEN